MANENSQSEEQGGRFPKSPSSAEMVVPEIIGLPGAMRDENLGGSGESAGFRAKSYERMKKAFPILTIEPAVAEYGTGSELYNLDFNGEYNDWLAQNNIRTFDGSSILRVACHNLSSPSETYSSSFAPNSLAESMSSVGNEMVADAMFLTGSSQLTGADSVAEKLAKSDNEAFKTVGESMQGIANKMSQWTESLQEKGGVGGKVGDIAAKIGKTLNKPGARIDFPLMWRSSSYSASYTFNTRLYNPLPANDKCYMNNIVAPLGALLALVLPRSDDGDLYQWPFLCRIVIPGLLRVKAAYVSSISVSKGGDANDYSLKNSWVRPNLVDVQISFGTLYNVMPMTLKSSDASDRPSLMDELGILTDGPLGEVETINNTPQNPDQSIDREPTPAERTRAMFLSDEY